MALDRLSQVTNSGISTTISFRSAGINVSGIVTASSFVGDGSGLTGVVGSGSGVIIKDDNATVGTASTINFGSNLSVSAISSGIVTVTGTDTNTTYTQAAVASGSNVNIRLSGSDSTTDDILLTAGSNVTFSSVTAAGFTINSSGSGGGSSSQFGETAAGIHTLSNVGIGTTNPTSTLTVSGVTSTTNLIVSGISTFNGALDVNSTSNFQGSVTLQSVLHLPSNTEHCVGDGLELRFITYGSGALYYPNTSHVRNAVGLPLYLGGGSVRITDDTGLTTRAVFTSTGLDVIGLTSTTTLNVGTGGTVITTTNGGLIGIGNTNPTKKLTVSGDALINGLTVGVGTGTITGNTVLGNNAFFSNTTGTNNTAVGSGVLYQNLTGNHNTAIGSGSQYFNGSGNYNTSTGSLALYGLVAGQYNVAIGYESARESYNVTGNVAIGGFALRSNYAGSNNVSIGYYAGYGVTTSNNVIIGPAPFGNVPNVTYQPPIPNEDTQLVIGAGNTAWIHGNSSYNIGIGTTNPTSKLTVFGDVKVSGVVTATSVSSSTINDITVGRGNITYNTDNTVIGYQAGGGTYGINNVSVGLQALRVNTTGNSNTAIGFKSLYANTGDGKSFNTALGADSLGNANASYNTAIGYYAGYFITSGSKNTILGAYDGNQNGLDIRTSNNNVVITDGDGNIRFYANSSGNVGLGTTNPARKLDVVDSGASGSVIRSKVTTNNGGYLAYEALNSSGTSVFNVTHNGRINLSENIVFASGQGLDFSATANSSGTMTSELLDDYEEGTWTPTIVIGGSSLSIDSTNCTYVKVGQIVTCWFEILGITSSNGSGAVFGGLPFSAGNNSEGAFAAMFNGVTYPAGTTQINGYHSGSSAEFRFYASGTGNGWVQLTGNDIGSGDIIGTIVYRAAS